MTISVVPSFSFILQSQVTLAPKMSTSKTDLHKHNDKD